jgi:uncharacterized membrane protein YgdD (TMEM256/DUF423 family)
VENKSQTLFAGVAAVLMAAGIASGALGAHALRDLLPSRNLESFNTGAEYLVYSALFLFAVSALSQFLAAKTYLWASRLILAGSLMFSLSIFALATLPLHGVIAVRALGPVTPIGGLMLISACLILAADLLRRR